MKNVNVSVKEGEVILTCGRKKNNGQLRLGAKCSLKATKNMKERNRVEVSPALYEDFRNCRPVLFNKKNGSIFDVVLRQNDALDGNSIVIAKAAAKAMGANTGGSLMLLKNKAFTFCDIDVQRMENVKDDVAVVSATDANGEKVCPEDFLFFQIFNYYTNESVVLKGDHIKIDDSLDGGTILLNRKQRAFLALDAPPTIQKKHWNNITANANAAQKQALEKVYFDDGNYFVMRQDVSHSDKANAQSLLKELCPPRLLMHPVVQSFAMKRTAGKSAIADFYVGKSAMSLMCRRPYESDEGANVVRLCPSNMHLLGVTEMDMVILRHKHNFLRCHVLPLDDERAFAKENLPTSLNYAIGIPAHLRHKLGIYSLDTAVKVERDTKFLLKKSVNEQVIPTLLTLFSVGILQPLNLWQKILAAVLALPIVIYCNLSSKRNMRG